MLCVLLIGLKTHHIGHNDHQKGNDDISFSGLLPKIRFERTGTLGNGSPYCDFHFLKVR
jgi:hypothetical protein